MGIISASYRLGENLPATSIESPASWFMNLMGSKRSISGVDVDPDNAISLSTVFNALLLLSESIAQLPVNPIITEPLGVGVDKKVSSRRIYREHPSYELVAKRPNDHMTSHTFRKVMMVNATKYDRAYAIIRRNNVGMPIELLPIPSPWVQTKLVDGQLVYRVTNYLDGGKVEYLTDYSMLHIIGYTDNGFEGRSRVEILANSLGNAISSENFASEYFGKGVNVSGFIKVPSMLKDETAVDRLKRSFVKAVAGKDNQFGVGLLEGGSEWIKNETNPEEAQLMETRKFDAVRVAQIWNIPVTLLKHLERGTYNNVEQLDIEFSKYTLQPWVTNWEQELERKLLTEAEKREGLIYYKFNMNAMLRGDMETRGKYYESMTKTGAFSPNKILELEDEEGFEGGDVHVVPSGYQTLEQLKENSDA